MAILCTDAAMFVSVLAGGFASPRKHRRMRPLSRPVISSGCLVPWFVRDNGPKLLAVNCDRHLAQLRSDFRIRSCLGTKRLFALGVLINCRFAFFQRVYLAFGMIDYECEQTHQFWAYILRSRG